MLPQLHIAQIEKAPKKDLEFVRDQLFQFNAQALKHSEINQSRPIHLFLRDEQHTLYGGIIADIAWRAMQIYTFWIEDSFRGKGYGVQLMQSAEKIAREADCRLLLLETTSFHNLAFYQEYGFETVGIIEDFPHGHNYYYLKCDLKP